MFEIFTSFFVSVFILFSSISGSVPPPPVPPEFSQGVSASTPIEVVSVKKSTPKKIDKVEQKPQEVKTAPKSAVLPTVEPKTAQAEEKKTKSFTTPSGAVIDEYGNTLYLPPNATTGDETQTTPQLQNPTPAPSQPYISPSLPPADYNVPAVSKTYSQKCKDAGGTLKPNAVGSGYLICKGVGANGTTLYTIYLK